MARIKCDFYMKNGMTISAIADIDSQEEYDEEFEKKQNHFEEIWFHNKRGFVGWGSTTINSEDCIPEERLGYDLYYVKHRTLAWEITIFIQYVAKLLTGRM